jgi:two-component system phosphate regulon sensor histidine kinase PhoR
VTFRTRTFVAVLVASTLTLAASTALVTTSLRRTLVADVEDSLVRQVRLAAELLADRGALSDPDGEADILSKLVGARVTFILEDGRVIGDSDVMSSGLDYVDNHLGREEVQEALADGTGVAIRRSVTTGDETMYAAASVRRGAVRFVRIGMSLTGIAERISATRSVAWMGLGVGLVAALLVTWGTSVWLSRRVRAIAHIAARYRQGDFSRPGLDFGRDEIGVVARVLDDAARDLGQRLEDVARERAHRDAIFQGMAEGALLADAQGRLVLSNPAIQAMLRLSDDPQGRHFLEVVRHPDVAAQLTAALTGLTPTPVEVRLDHDSHRAYIARVVPVAAARGGGAVLVLHDVTELRQADQVRRDFVANVSHELRTPLTAIRGFTEALTDSTVTAVQQRKFLEIIARHAFRMERLVDDLLRLARLDAHQEHLHPTSVSVTSLLGLVVGDLEQAMNARNVTIDITIAADAATVHGDPAKLHDVFRNLLENATNYSPADGRIEMDACRVGDGIAITVSDRGPGIPDTELPRIFERFYRVDRSRTSDSRDPGGTGLGLSIVRHLVEMHGGSVSARNREGGGTTVTVQLHDARA